jgi:hypothetical protein
VDRTVRIVSTGGLLINSFERSGTATIVSVQLVLCGYET